MVIENLSSLDRTMLFHSDQVHNILSQMAYQIRGMIADHPKIAIIGLLRRGAPIADLLLQKLRNHGENRDILRLDLDVKRYADDLSILYPKTLLKVNDETRIVNLSGYIVILVDDVLYTGNSLFSVINHLVEKNSPDMIFTACLVDRCATELPVIANISGLKLQVSADCIVECNIPPYEPSLKILLASPRVQVI